MTEARRNEEEGSEPTLVMGASMVMEWIRAIEECLRCELPGSVKGKTSPYYYYYY